MREKGWFLLIVGCQVINIEGTMELESHQWMLKLVGESLMKNRIFSQPQIIFPQVLIYYRGTIVILQWRIPVDTPLPNDQSQYQINILGLLMWCTEKNTASLPGNSCSNASAESNHEKASDKPKWKNILQNNWPAHLKNNVKIKKCQERLKKSPRSKEMKRHMTTESTVGSCNPGSWTEEEE